MVDLRNVNHSFDIARGDVGCTIRKGTKWALVPRGTLLRLMNCSAAHDGECSSNTCKEEGLGQLLGLWTGKLRELPPSLLLIEHNNDAKDKKILMKMLNAGYGSITYEDIVTAMIYERKR